MHELAIADSIVRIASEHAAGRRVASVQVVIGRLRQVVPASLEFSFGLVAESTPVEGAALEIEAAEAGGRCRACGAESTFGDFPLACRACGSLDVEVTRGEELYVASLELEEAGVAVR